MTLATVGADGRPSTRVVLLKGCDACGFVFYTNYESRKGQELAANPQAALQFHWVELERVARIEGRVEKTGAEESDEYYQVAAARFAPRRLGLAAEPGDRLARGLVAEAARIGAQVRARSAAAAALGRLPAGPGQLRVLAGPRAAACTTGCATRCSRTAAGGGERLAP